MSTDPYRSSEPMDVELAPRFSWWRYVYCCFAGHRWCITLTNAIKANALAQHHPLAGSNAYCRRCGRTWIDAGPGSLSFRSLEELVAAHTVDRAKAEDIVGAAEDITGVGKVYIVTRDGEVRPVEANDDTDDDGIGFIAIKPHDQ